MRIFYRLIYTGFGWMAFLETIGLTAHGWSGSTSRVCILESREKEQQLPWALLMVLVRLKGAHENVQTFRDLSLKFTYSHFYPYTIGQASHVSRPQVRVWGGTLLAFCVRSCKLYGKRSWTDGEYIIKANGFHSITTHQPARELKLILRYHKISLGAASID